MPIKRPASETEENSYSEDYAESEYSNDSFIVKDDKEELAKNMVRNLTGYDPTLYKHIDKLSTKDMESSADRILSEERRTAKIGRLEDKRELERLKRH